MSAQSLINQVHEGMEVYDSLSKRIGYVNAIRAGASELQPKLPDIVIMRETVDEWLGSTTNLPMAMYTNIYRDGFISISHGLFRSDMIILPTQIAKIGANTLFIKIPRTDLQMYSSASVD